MRRLLKIILFGLTSVFFLSAAFLFHVVTFALPGRQRLLAGLVVLWAKTTTALLGIDVSFSGREHLNNSGMLIVANHQSYLDIIILASVIPTLFVAKKEVRSWPLLGWLATLGGTLYIDRTAFRGASEAMEKIISALRGGTNVLVFPEGTSTNGELVAPFRPALFRSAVNAERSILPVTINYVLVSGENAGRRNRDLFCWYGAMTFTDHFWRLLNVRSLTSHIVIHPPIPHSSPSDPKELSETAFLEISKGFHPFID
ncbi:MAG: lysophospholipid acyltransferase family protein [Bacteroidota bacterium]